MNGKNRVPTPGEGTAAVADYLVFGRPIDTTGMEYESREQLMEQTRRAIEQLREDARRVLEN